MFFLVFASMNARFIVIFNNEAVYCWFSSVGNRKASQVSPHTVLRLRFVVNSAFQFSQLSPNSTLFDTTYPVEFFSQLVKRQFFALIFPPISVRLPSPWTTSTTYYQSNQANTLRDSRDKFLSPCSFNIADVDSSRSAQATRPLRSTRRQTDPLADR